MNIGGGMKGVGVGVLGVAKIGAIGVGGAAVARHGGMLSSVGLGVTPASKLGGGIGIGVLVVTLGVVG